VSANQGSATKYQHVAGPRNLYSQAPSRVPAQQIVSLFVCSARRLEGYPAAGTARSEGRRKSEGPAGLVLAGDAPESGGGDAATTRDCFVVEILERHPFTTQMFVPLGTTPGGRYLVIVAPSLPPSPVDEALPVPNAADGGELPGRGLPDLRGLSAFVATADQAVSYGAGTWHAPMVALGPEGTTVDFVVVQAANGVGIEDCQEVVFASEGRTRPEVVVRVPLPRVAKL